MSQKRVGEQRGDELQQTVLMGSASSVLELPATSCSSSALTSACSTASTMGITMAVVDVLESHMDSSVVQHMKQSSSLQGREGRAERCWGRHLQGLNLAPHGAPLGFPANPTFWHYPEKWIFMSSIQLWAPRLGIE